MHSPTTTDAAGRKEGMRDCQCRWFTRWFTRFTRWFTRWLIRANLLFPDPETELQFLATARYSLVMRLTSGVLTAALACAYGYALYDWWLDEATCMVASVASMGLFTLASALLVLSAACMRSPRRMVITAEAAMFTLAASLLSYIPYTWCDTIDTADMMSTASRHFIQLFTNSSSSNCTNANLDSNVTAPCFIPRGTTTGPTDCTALEWLMTFARMVGCVCVRAACLLRSLPVANSYQRGGDLPRGPGGG